MTLEDIEWQNLHNRIIALESKCVKLQEHDANRELDLFSLKEKCTRLEEELYRKPQIYGGFKPEPEKPACEHKWPDKWFEYDGSYKCDCGLLIHHKPDDKCTDISRDKDHPWIKQSRCQCEQLKKSPTCPECANFYNTGYADGLTAAKDVYTVGRDESPKKMDDQYRASK